MSALPPIQRIARNAVPTPTTEVPANNQEEPRIENHRIGEAIPKTGKVLSADAMTGLIALLPTVPGLRATTKPVLTTPAVSESPMNQLIAVNLRKEATDANGKNPRMPPAKPVRRGGRIRKTATAEMSLPVTRATAKNQLPADHTGKDGQLIPEASARLSEAVVPIETHPMRIAKDRKDATRKRAVFRKEGFAPLTRAGKTGMGRRRERAFPAMTGKKDQPAPNVEPSMNPVPTVAHHETTHRNARIIVPHHPAEASEPRIISPTDRKTLVQSQEESGHRRTILRRGFG